MDVVNPSSSESLTPGEPAEISKSNPSTDPTSIVFKALQPLLDFPRTVGMFATSFNCCTGEVVPRTKCSILKTCAVLLVCTYGFALQIKTLVETAQSEDNVRIVTQIPLLLAYSILPLAPLWTLFSKKFLFPEFWQVCKMTDGALREILPEAELPCSTNFSKLIYFFRALMIAFVFVTTQVDYFMNSGYSSISTESLDTSSLKWYIEYVVRHVVALFYVLCTAGFCECLTLVVSRHLVQYFAVVNKVIFLVLVGDRDQQHSGLPQHMMASTSVKDVFDRRSRPGRHGLPSSEGRESATLSRMATRQDLSLLKAWEVYENACQLARTFNRAIGIFILIEHGSSLIRLICLAYAHLRAQEANKTSEGYIFGYVVFSIAYHAFVNHYCSELHLVTHQPRKLLSYYLSRNWPKDEDPYQVRSFLNASSIGCNGITALGCYFMVTRATFLTYVGLIVTYVAFIWQASHGG